MDLKIGQTIESRDGKQGIIRYIGTLHIAKGDWLGLELPDRSGKNDGSVQGERYFSCEQGYGIFIRKESAVKILKQPGAAARPSVSAAITNGGAVKSRPSAVGVTPDTARKRQSMMSTGSANAGSRMSLRSPTKSPTKPMSSASSAASTPRTGTPATTARTSDSSAKSRLSTAGRQSMAPPPPPAPKKTSTATRQSIGVGLGRVTPTVAAPRAVGSRASVTGARLSLQPKSTTPRSTASGRSVASDEDSQPQSPPIQEDEEEAPQATPQSIDQVLDDAQPIETSEPPIPLETAPSEPTHSRSASVSRTNNHAESRAADRKEVEQLKAKLRTLEKRASDDRDKLQKFDALQTDKDRYETIIQTLQKKLKANQQTMSELRTLKDEAEQKANLAPVPSGEFESELELANLDKEMAEERAELAQTELDILKAKHEEMELELEILREENRELGSTMSPAELSSAGWLQKEREVDRLRQALGLLRDHARETEDDLQSQIKELQETVDETGKMASQYEETAAKLAQVESTNKHLMEQLEDAETNDDVVVALETQREQSVTTIEQLRRQIQELEEHIQVTDELEKFHLEEERQLHYELDDSEAHLNETSRHITEQEKVIEELEFTLSKFREVVSGLQGDIDELRRSRDLNETQANEMNVKSRAMMDLNLQLQNSAAKTQLKTIDYEMRDMQAEQAKSHLEIVQLFVPESFDQDRNPVLALLAFKRIKSKAGLVRTLLAERMRDRPHLAQDDPFTVFETMEKMDLMASCCERFLRLLATCSHEIFSAFGGAVYELEPVERAVTGWVDALRRDEMGPESPEVLHRMISILQDMSEKLITESNEVKATELVEQTIVSERFAEISALQLSALMKAVQQRLGEPSEDDEEAIAFDKKMDASATKARTIKYLCSKVTQSLKDLRSGSMCLGETSWASFADVQEAAAQLSATVRNVGKAITTELNNPDPDQPLTYTTISDLMTAAASSSTDFFTHLTHSLTTLQSKIDGLSTRTADISSAVEFESSTTSPWAARAKQLRQAKLASQDTAEEVTRLRTKNDGHVRDLAEKHREAEELRIRVELLESRQKENKIRDGEVKALREEVERVKVEKEALVLQAETTKAEMEEAVSRQVKEREELQALKAAAMVDGGAAAEMAALGGDGEGGEALRAEADMLRCEVLQLQSAVRYLQAENWNLRVPVGEIALRAERNAWLDPQNLKSRKVVDEKRAKVQRGSREVMEGLIELAEGLEGVKLKQRDGKEKWTKMEGSTRWIVARQREEVERWKGEVAEVGRRARIELRPATGTRSGRRGVGKGCALPDLPDVSGAKGLSHEGDGRVVRVVGVDGA